VALHPAPDVVVGQLMRTRFSVGMDRDGKLRTFLADCEAGPGVACRICLSTISSPGFGRPGVVRAAETL